MSPAPPLGAAPAPGGERERGGGEEEEEVEEEGPANQQPAEGRPLCPVPSPRDPLLCPDGGPTRDAASAPSRTRGGGGRRNPPRTWAEFGRPLPAPRVPPPGMKGGGSRLRWERRAGRGTHVLTNALLCRMRSLKCYVNIEGGLFTFCQQGKFPLTRSHFLPPHHRFLPWEFLFCFQALFSSSPRSMTPQLRGLPPTPYNWKMGFPGGGDWTPNIP